MVIIIHSIIVNILENNVFCNVKITFDMLKISNENNIK